ncbi:sortase B protein-sorting domain-containing protein [Halobacillus alkaliphilus]
MRQLVLYIQLIFVSLLILIKKYFE